MVSSRMSEKAVANNEATNFSTAKAKYSFGREARFPSVGKAPLNHTIYNLPSTLKKRGCSFGFGDRFQSPQKALERSRK